LLTPSVHTLEIDLLVLPDTNLLLLAAVIEPLRAANRISGHALYRWRILTSEGQPVETTSDIAIAADGVFGLQEPAVPLFVLASYHWRRHAGKSLKMRLSRAARNRPLLAGIESGSWLLAECGLLNGHTAAVHWEDFEEFETAFPQITLTRDRYSIDARRITTGGPLPTLDLMLEIVRRRQGYSLALEVSRLFIYDRSRLLEDAAQTVCSIGGMPVLDARVDRAVRLMEENIDQPLRLSGIAKAIGISARHLQELFRDNVGVAPHLHYLALRLNAARRLVIETRASLADIASAAGFNSASAFSRCYRAHFGESASGTRKLLRDRR
jgi:transcriptional regulator GlxA family with amidase domain